MNKNKYIRLRENTKKGERKSTRTHINTGTLMFKYRSPIKTQGDHSIYRIYVSERFLYFLSTEFKILSLYIFYMTLLWLITQRVAILILFGKGINSLNSLGKIKNAMKK